MSAVVLKDMKESRCHLPLKLRTCCTYFSGAAENRGSCSHEVAVIDITRETTGTSRANIEEEDDDYEYVERSAEVTECANDIRDSAGPKPFSWAFPGNLFPLQVGIRNYPGGSQVYPEG